MDNNTFISAVDMIEEQASKNPSKIALSSTARSYTYKAFNERSNSVANSLINLGIEKEERVLIYLPRVLENYIANIGILKAGGAFVNASVSYPYERVVDIFEQASCRFVITNKSTFYDNAELFKQLDVIPLFIEQLMVNPNKNNPGVEINASNLCYVIFTSGSTGRPKGVMIEHGNLANFLDKSPENTESYLIMKNGSSVLAMAQFTFDMSVMEEFLALAAGMKLVLATDSEITDAKLINELLGDNGVDTLIVTPAYLNMLIDIPLIGESIKRIKVMDFGAEAFPPALYDKIRKVNPNVLILNGYGPTEATISCTVKVIESADDITIGFPNGNVSAVIVDENLNELARGTEGELLICGKGVGRGYMNLKEQTDKVFVNFNGMKAYRTGDFAIMRDNGEIEYRGRRDSQVKLRGLRIELGEIETVASSNSLVKHCAAEVFDGKLLVLYYSAQGELGETELKDYLNAHLAHYLMPDRLIRLDEMPMTDNRKIDRKALKKPEIIEEAVVPPTNDIERKLLTICNKYCPEEIKGINSNLINTGISSLGFIGLIAEIESEFMVRISIADVFANPSVFDIARYIADSKKREVFRPKDRYPVSHDQLITYHDFELRPSDMCWNLNYYYEMPLSIDPTRLAKAITGAFVLHPELLSNFVKEDGVLWQIPAPDELIFTPEIKHITDAEWEKMIPTLGKAFDLTGRELLFEIYIYVTESRVILYVDFAHIIIDGDSLDIFLKDTVLLYGRQQVEPEEMSVYELMFEEEKQIAAFYAECKNYYETLIDKDAEFRSVAPHLGGESSPMIMRPLKTSMSDLDAICKKYNVSNNIIASAAFGYVLAKESGLEDSLHTVSSDNRFDSSLLHTVGYMCRNLPMYCHIEEGAKWEEYLSMVADQSRRNLIYPATAEKYMDDAEPNYVKNLVIFQSEMSDDFEIDGITAKGSMVAHPIEVTNYDIVLQLFPMSGALIAVLVIDSRKYDAQFGNHFLDVIDDTFADILNKEVQ